jgi:hypothetical protein
MFMDLIFSESDISTTYLPYTVVPLVVLFRPTKPKRKLKCIFKECNNNSQG